MSEIKLNFIFIYFQFYFSNIIKYEIEYKKTHISMDDPGADVVAKFFLVQSSSILQLLLFFLEFLIILMYF
jgi:hypothetical protein